jgi:hypothetical protein
LPVSCGTPRKIKNSKVNSKDEVFYPNTVGYKCEEGYTVTGLAGGESSFERKCEEDANFAVASKCKPVKCGAPAPVKDSTYNKAELFYSQSVTYVCDAGYTMTGKAGESIQETIVCGADGQFEKNAPRCLPVECGAPPRIEFGAAIDAPSLVTFADDALEYQCEPGYSTIAADNPWEPAANTFSISCKADGTFQPAPDCVNINDCLFHDCSADGACVNVEKPTGEPFDDYTCDCNAGFMITLHDGTGQHEEHEKKCTNIDDCPVPEACGGRNAAGHQRGTCEDLIEDYTCVCGSGYELSFLKNPPKNRTCSPVACGAVPDIREASHGVEGPANYDTPQWTYTCNAGYSTTGEASGSKTFEARCTAAGAFSKPSECLPVTCGSVKAAPHADRDTNPGELFFPEEVKYTCDDGYSLDSQADGEKSFKVKCQEDGTQSKMHSCKAVECGEIPRQNHATIEIQKVYTFGKSGTVACDEGYSLDGSTNAMRMDYDRTCQADGTFSEEKACQPVECGVSPEVRHAVAGASSFLAQPAMPVANNDVKVFGDEVTYKLDAGYSLDGTTTGATSFTVRCRSNGKFSRPQEPLPISCGAAPDRDHASTPKAQYVFQEVADYTCMSGYSTDGTAGGSKAFTLECEAKGEFMGDAKCSPVICGAVEVPEHANHVADSDGETHASLVFGQHAQLECKPGYSLNGKLNSKQMRSKVECQADGKLLYPEECKNDDDCVASDNQCSPHGKCKDKPNPTGDHLKDFKCICDSGFKENVTSTGVRSCKNIPDCPLGACDPGTCKDLVNDYKCVCPAGYKEEPDKSRGLAHACMPVPCGTPTKVQHASTDMADQDINFAMDPVEYKCDKGYTLDASPRGPDTFALACLEQGVFERAPKCQAVECGKAPAVDNADFNEERSFTFEQTVRYSCHQGYAVGGSDESFQARCEADGTFSGVEACDPVACATPCKTANGKTTCESGAFGGNAVFDQVAVSQMVFPKKVTVECNPGFSTDKDQHDANSFVVKC